MAFTFDADLSTDRDKVRWKIRDVDSARPAFSDAQVAAALTEGGTVNGAVGVLARIVLMARARFGQGEATIETGADGNPIPNPAYVDPSMMPFLQTLADTYGGGATLPVVTVGSLGSYPSTPTST